eukprot:TRINITY_DN1368_c0_g1_i1.p1 TRINITY_DN1368_c0_g1~~TRINITY_DN1368_c0_g1_i1.p1  ORF type:complete len:208 (-),score=90.71 TRINITY_DN1368_c0_g1_i1:134-757(-)
MGNKQGKSSSKGISSEKGEVANIVVGNIYEKFTSENVPITKEVFCRNFFHLSELGLSNSSNVHFASRIFDVLDSDKNGVIDKKEFFSGLALVGKGSPEEKILLTFKAFDKDGSNTISSDELRDMFITAWISGVKILMAQQNKDDFTNDELKQYAEENITPFAIETFYNIDINGDGQLSFEEFKNYASSNPKMVANISDFQTQVSLTL